MKTYLKINEWLKLPKDLRTELILKFQIGKSSTMSVVDGKIVCDGCTQEDLIKGITIGKMIELIGDDWKKVPNDELFDYLFNKFYEKNKEENTELPDEQPVQQRNRRGRS